MFEILHTMLSYGAISIEDLGKDHVITHSLEDPAKYVSYILAMVTSLSKRQSFGGFGITGRSTSNLGSFSIALG